MKLLASIAFPVLIIIVSLSSISPGFSTPTHAAALYATASNQPLQAWMDSPQNTTNATTTSFTSTTMLTNSSDPRVDVTVDSFPEGAELITIDGSSIVTPTVYSWQTGSVHTLSAVSSLSCGTSCQFVFQSWSDGGEATHTVTAPNSPTIYIAVYQKQYLLTIQSNAGGTTTPPTGWQNANAAVPILATPNSGFTFVDWNGSTFVSWTGSGSGSFNGTSASAWVTMNGPITENATFAPMTAETVITTSTQTALNTTVQYSSEQITITSNPTSEGIISVDGTSITTPQTFTWTNGTTHVLFAPQTSPCLNPNGSVNYSCRFVFQNWFAQSSGFINSNSFIYTVPSLSETVIANYQQQQNPNFALSITPSTVFLPQDVFIGSTSFTLTLTSISGWNGSIQFTTSQLPAGVTLSFMPSAYSLDTPYASWNVIVNIAASARPGSYPIEITATSGPLIQTAYVTVLVTGSAARSLV